MCVCGGGGGVIGDSDWPIHGSLTIVIVDVLVDRVARSNVVRGPRYSSMGV